MHDNLCFSFLTKSTLYKPFLLRHGVVSLRSCRPGSGMLGTPTPHLPRSTDLSFLVFNCLCSHGCKIIKHSEPLHWPRNVSYYTICQARSISCLLKALRWIIKTIPRKMFIKNEKKANVVGCILKECVVFNDAFASSSSFTISFIQKKLTLSLRATWVFFPLPTGESVCSRAFWGSEFAGEGREGGEKGQKGTQDERQGCLNW